MYELSSSVVAWPYVGIFQCADGHLFCSACLRRRVEESTYGGLPAFGPLLCIDMAGCDKTIPLSEVGFDVVIETWIYACLNLCTNCKSTSKIFWAQLINFDIGVKLLTLSVYKSLCLLKFAYRLSSLCSFWKCDISCLIIWSITCQLSYYLPKYPFKNGDSYSV